MLLANVLHSKNCLFILFYILPLPRRQRKYDDDDDNDDTDTTTTIMLNTQSNL
jgi:hypothetical protein